MSEIGIKFYSKAIGASNAATLSTTEAGSIVFDKTSKAIYVNGVKYGGSLVSDATLDSNVLTITKTDNTSFQIDFAQLASASSVTQALQDINAKIGLSSGAGNYIPSADTSYVSNTTVQSVNSTDVIDPDGSDADTVAEAVSKLDNKGKAIMSEVISTKKDIETVIGAAGLESDGTYDADSNANYIDNATSLTDADSKLDAALKSVSDKVDAITDNAVTDVAINGVSITDNSTGEVDIAVDGTYDSDDNKIATVNTVTTAIGNLSSSATIATVNNNVVTIKAGVEETAGVVDNTNDSDIVLEEVAVTGAAADVSISDVANKFTATNVEDALKELATSIEDNEITIASGENIISKSSSNELSTTLTVDIERQGEVGSEKDYIVLKGINGAEISKVDASAFVVDGMLDTAELVTTAEQGVNVTTPYIKLTFNTDSGKQPIRFSVSSLVDTYSSGDSAALTVSNYTITPNTGAVAENAGTLTTGGQVYTAIAATKGQDIQTITGETATTQGSYINVKVTATKGQNSDDYTLSTTSNVTTHAVSTAAANNDGLATALDVKTYVDGQVGTAVQSVDVSSAESSKSVSQSDYATVKISATTDSDNDVELESSIGLKIQEINTAADPDHMGLAEASDVKNYVDSHTATVVNKSATITPNNSNATEIATVDGTSITAKVSFNWEEYE